MNGINNNISNANYNSLGNKSSNGAKEEESFFDKALDSIKDFFAGDDEVEKDTKPVRVLSGSALDRAAYLAKLEVSGTYTMAPTKEEETLTEKWKRENETIQIKQKQKEIARLEKNVTSLKTENKKLTKENEEMVQMLHMSQLNQVGQVKATSQENMVSEIDEASQEQVQNKPLPTHTSIPRAVLEKQQNEIQSLEEKPSEEKLASEESVELNPTQEETKA